ncbi:MAG: type VII secretion protein EccC, partial [Propionibacterium sp.]
MRDLVNVGGVAARSEYEVIRRTLEEVTGLLQERENLFQRYQVDSLAGLRQVLNDRSVNLAEVVLLIDGYGQLAEEFEDLSEMVFDLLRRGGAHGIHVVATTNRWNEIRLAQQSFFGTKIELRLSDPTESAHGRKLAETISAERPGRALLAGGLFAHIALPRIDQVASADDLAEGLRKLSEAVSAGAVERAVAVRLLPTDLKPDQVKIPPGKAEVALGLDERDLSTVVLDTEGADRHLVIFGDAGTGRTTMLRRLVSELVRTHGPDELVFAVVDPRRSLTDVVPKEYLGGVATSAVLAQKLVAAIAPEIEGRVPNSVDENAKVSPATPKVIILIDDYDALGSGASPFSALLPYIPMGQEVGLSVVLTRRMTGASRAMYDQLIST